MSTTNLTITEFARMGGLARAAKLGKRKCAEIAKRASEAAKRAASRRKRTPKARRAA